MKLISKLVFLIALMVGLGSVVANAQKYKVLTHPETQEKMLVGIVNLSNIEEMDGFENLMTEEAFKGDEKALERISVKLSDVNIVAYIGTWCSDSQYQFPEFINLMKQAGFDVAKIKIYALDNEKKTLQGELPGNNIEFVPTIIFSKGDKEIGRIVEQPQKSFIKDIDAILSK